MPLTPYTYNLANRILWVMTSKAFVKSQNFNLLFSLMAVFTRIGTVRKHSASPK